jgi:hypothetical protein
VKTQLEIKEAAEKTLDFLQKYHQCLIFFEHLKHFLKRSEFYEEYSPARHLNLELGTLG